MTPGKQISAPKLSDPDPLSPLHWEAFIFCPTGLSSYDMKRQNLKNIQSWYIDLQTGAVFPYPSNPKEQTFNWLLSLVQRPLEPSRSTSNSSEESTKRPYLTYTLIVLNLILFMMMTLAGGSTRADVLIRYGAKVNDLILQGEVWRFLTSIFLHIGYVHLAFNLYALWILGPITEELLGRIRYAIIYFLSGISGSIVSFLFVDALSAGASGAIFGVLGALVPYTRKNPALWKSGFGRNLVIIIVVNLSLGFFQPGIDMYAHLGGLACGLILGRLFP